MEAARRFTLAHRWIAALVVAMALAMKVLVPAGYMIGSEGKTLTVMVCDGSGGQAAMTDTMPMSKSDKRAGSHSLADHQCPYSALTMNALSPTDPALLETALAFIVLLGLAALQPPWSRRDDHLRPPLRGPPVVG